MDVAKVVKQEYPEYEDKLTNAAFDSSMKRLVAEGAIEVQRKGVGRTVPALYRKLRQSAKKILTGDEFMAAIDEEMKRGGEI